MTRPLYPYDEVAIRAAALGIYQALVASDGDLSDAAAACSEGATREDRGILATAARAAFAAARVFCDVANEEAKRAEAARGYRANGKGVFGWSDPAAPPPAPPVEFDSETPFGQ